MFDYVLSSTMHGTLHAFNYFKPCMYGSVLKDLKYQTKGSLGETLNREVNWWELGQTEYLIKTLFRFFFFLAERGLLLNKYLNLKLAMPSEKKSNHFLELSGFHF